MKKHNEATPIARNKDIVIKELEDEILIYDLSTNRAVCLNRTSAFVFRNCDGKNTVSSLRRKMAMKTKSFVNEEFIWLALDQLSTEGLLQSEETLPDFFGGLSRREIIRKVGFISAIALPIVSSVVAPNASMAQSGGAPLFASCGSDPQCSSGNCVTGTCCSPTSIADRSPGVLIGCVGLGPISCSSATRTACCSGDGEQRVHPPCPLLGCFCD